MGLYGASKTAEEARSFLKNLIEKAPFVISKILTDNGKEFTDRFCPTGKHLFDQECAEHSIEHRLIKPRKPQTNGMAERFNGRIKEIIQQTRFESAQQLEETLIRYLDIYNSNIPQRNLGHVTPMEALSKWRKTHPDLFKKSESNHPGLDNYVLLRCVVRRSSCAFLLLGSENRAIILPQLTLFSTRQKLHLQLESTKDNRIL